MLNQSQMERNTVLEKFFEELYKHFLAVAAAILIAVLVGIFIQDPRPSIWNVVLGLVVYFAFLGIAFFVFRISEKFAKKQPETKS